MSLQKLASIGLSAVGVAGFISVRMGLMGTNEIKLRDEILLEMGSPPPPGYDNKYIQKYEAIIVEHFPLHDQASWIKYIDGLAYEHKFESTISIRPINVIHVDLNYNETIYPHSESTYTLTYCD